MDHFCRQHGVLCAEDVPLAAVAAAHGTPTYVYSRATIERHVRVLQQSLEAMPHHICYAVKANGNLGLLGLLADLGIGFDGVSLGELWRVRQAGGDLNKTIFSGVGKRDDEIAQALHMGVLYVSAESPAEVAAIAAEAARAQVVANISLRINPEVDAATHPYISTGMANNKFGVPQEALWDLLDLVRALPSVRLVGLSCHIGSQITSMRPFVDAANILAEACRQVQAAGFALRYVGMGGGLGIAYAGEVPPSPAQYGASLQAALGGLGLTLVLEPGRVLVGNAGVLLARVVRRKRHGERTFVLLDAGMNDLLRPALYQASHQIEAVAVRPGTPEVIEVVGPVCESADTFAASLACSPLSDGDLVAIRSAGAYGMVMASNYNGRPKPAEVMCSGKHMDVIGRREALDELWRLEQLLPAAKTQDTGHP